jgi:hypothetical protein
MLPPCIDIDEEEDYEEAKVPCAETSDKENRPVEVCISRGMGGEADTGGGVQAHHHQMYAPGTPQRATCRSLSPTPDGFVHNHGQNYIPLRIPTTNGWGIAIAKWVKVRMGVNPTAWGCMYRGGVVYQGDVHAAPNHNHGPIKTKNTSSASRTRQLYSYETNLRTLRVKETRISKGKAHIDEALYSPSSASRTRQLRKENYRTCVYKSFHKW